jgi:hypothetical protein
MSGFQWQLDCEATAFSKRTFRLDTAIVRIHYTFYIAKAQTKSLYIMDIAGMRPVELLKDALDRFTRHTDTVILDADDEFFIGG